MSTGLFEVLIREIEALLDPIAYVAEHPEALDRVLGELGETSPNSERDSLVAVLAAVVDVKTQIDGLAAQPSPSLASIAALLEALRQAFVAVRGLDEVGGPAGAFAGLGDDLASYLISDYLDSVHPLARSIAVLATLIEPAEELEPRPAVIEGDQLVRGPFVLDRFRFDRLVPLVRDPAATLRGEYGNALATVDDAHAMAEKLFPRLQRVLGTLGVSCRYGFNPGDEDLLGDAAPFVKHALIIYVQDLLAGAPAEAGVVLSLSPADHGDLGLVVSPFGELNLTEQLGDWALELRFTADVDVLAYGRHGLTLVASPSTAEVAGSIAATLAAPEDGPAFILGAPDGSRLEVGGAVLKIETSLSEARQSLALSADVSSSALVIAPGDGDGFLSSILPAEGLQAKFDLGLAWSNERGLTFRGAGSLDATLPVGLSIRDVVTVPTIHLQPACGRRGSPGGGIGQRGCVDRPGRRGYRARWHRCDTDLSRGRRQPRRCGPGLSVQAADRRGPRHRRLSRRRRRLPELRCSKGGVRRHPATRDCGEDRGQGHWVADHAATRRQQGLLLSAPHFRGRLCPDPTGVWLCLDGHRRVAGDQPHVQRRGAARRAQEPRAGQRDCFRKTRSATRPKSSAI